MKCAECAVRGPWQCEAGLSSYVIDGALGCRTVDVILDAYHFNEAKDTSTSSFTTDRSVVEWIWELADNGWVNHICPNCGYTKNTDIHVRFDWDFCPICGNYNGGGKSG